MRVGIQRSREFEVIVNGVLQLNTYVFLVHFPKMWERVLIHQAVQVGCGILRGEMGKSKSLDLSDLWTAVSFRVRIARAQTLEYKRWT